MILETGTIVFLSLAVLFWRLPMRTRLWLFGRPAWLEVPFGLLAYILHWGTFSGMMAAAAAACICFGFVQVGRQAIGYVRDGTYYPGIFRVQVFR